MTVNYKNQERPAFCCAEHAALWLLGRERRLWPTNIPEQQRIERIVLTVAGVRSAMVLGDGDWLREQFS